MATLQRGAAGPVSDLLERKPDEGRVSAFDGAVEHDDRDSCVLQELDMGRGRRDGGHADERYARNLLAGKLQDFVGLAVHVVFRVADEYLMVHLVRLRGEPLLE